MKYDLKEGRIFLPSLYIIGGKMSNAKAILFGEHSVVYGKNAIAIPLLNMKLKVNLINDYIYENNHIKFIKELIKSEYNIEDEIYIEVVSNIPEGRGLGSSAALAKACVIAFENKYGININTKEIMDKSEEYAHGKSSGLDTSVILSSKPIIFNKNKGSKEFDFSLGAYLLIIDTGVKGFTKIAVDHVKDNYIKYYRNIENLGNISDMAKDCIIKSNLDEIGKLMKEAQKNLREMSLSNEKIDDIIKSLDDYSLGSKITGSGMGGCVISLFKDLSCIEDVKKILKEKGVENLWIEDI